MACFPSEVAFSDMGLRADFKIVKPAPTFENAKKLFDVVWRNRQEFALWFRWVDFISSPEDEFSQIQSIADSAACKYLITNKTGDIVGNVGVVAWSHTNKTAEIGYWLDANARGRGIITNAVSEIEKLLFAQDDVTRIQIRAAVKNVSSRAVAQRLGYVEEGTLRQAEFVRQNLVQDVVMYSKLKSEWQGKR